MGEDGAAPVRAADAPDASGTPTESRKRARANPDSGHLGRVAEIVMVLSAMGQMRAGRDPTEAEKALMAEAREKLAKVCESMELPRRKELFTKEMAMAVVVDHGLNPPKENIPRPPKLSIAEKVANTKRKMEEAKEINVQSSAHPSQLLHVNFGVKPEGRSPLSQGAQRFFPDKASTVTPGISPTAASGTHASPVAYGVSALKQSQMNEVQRGLCPLKSFSTPASSSVRLPEKIFTTVQVTPTTTASSIQANKVQQAAAKVDNMHGFNVFQPSAQLIQDTKTYAVQAVSGNQQFIHQFPHVVNLNDSSVFNSHNEISKMVQRILPPKTFDQLNWVPPSTEYINKPLYCLQCNIMINDVESLLVCDSCEKGVHTKCLFSYSQRIVPKAEWHCPNCLSSSNGKPLPPKYGRVTRSISASSSRSSPGTGSIQASSEKKADNVNSHQKMSSHGKADLLTLFHTSSLHSHNESSTANKTVDTVEKDESGLSVIARKLSSDAHTTLTIDHSEGKSLPPTVPDGYPQNLNTLQDGNQQNLNTGLVPCQTQQQHLEPSLQTVVDTEHVGSKNSARTIDVNPISQELSSLQTLTKEKVARDEVSSELSVTELNDSSDLKHSSSGGVDFETGRESVAFSEGTPSETFDGNCSKPCVAIHNVEWVGDAIQTTDGRSYYHSCCVNGVTCKLQDYVLISNNGNCSPSKLQALWEDHTSGTKWALVRHFPNSTDIPEIVPKPAIPSHDEVYETNKSSTILAESISGLCHVLPPNEFDKETAKRGYAGDSVAGLSPMFLCRWFYDESSGVFQAIH